MKIYQHVVYFEENKLSIRKKGPQYCITPFYSKYIAMFNELVIKNTPVKELVNFNFVLSTWRISYVGSNFGQVFSMLFMFSRYFF